ncbi:MAG: efflux RND transporter periplasmic adaptor subunit [Oscillospiraceae bacterium]|nr:efflux RND transporter periplasmic adaptor subunit [Oscillospiraceae bacterium]
MTSPRSRQKTALAGVAAALGLTVFLSGCSGAQGGAPGGKGAMPAQAGQASTAISVNLTTASTGTIVRETEFAGRIEASQTVSVYAGTSGQVLTTYFNVGEEVQAGDLLADLDGENLANSLELAELKYQSALNSAQSSLLNSEKSYNSQSKSYQTAVDNLKDFEDEYDEVVDAAKAKQTAAQKALTAAKEALVNDTTGDPDGALQQAVDEAQADYDDAADEYSTTKSEYDRKLETYKTARNNARDDLEYTSESYSLTTGEGLEGVSGSVATSIRQAQLEYESAQKAMEDAKIYAPVSGIISAKNIEDYEMASSNSAAFTIRTDGSPVIAFNASEAGANALSIGSQITVTYEGTQYAAEVIEIATDANSSGLYPVKARTLEDMGTSRTGAVVKVTAATARAEDAMIIDMDYIEYDENQPYVYLFRDGVAVRADLELGISDNESVVVVSGLSAGDQIITTWHPDLKDGAAVSDRAAASTEAPAAAGQPEGAGPGKMPQGGAPEGMPAGTGGKGE